MSAKGDPPFTELRERAAALAQERERHEELAASLSRQARQGVATEHLFRRLIESVRDYAIFMLDDSGRVATWNIGAERINGYRADEIIGRHFSVFYPPADVDGGKCELELEMAAKHGRFEDEGWRVRKDGSRLWANVIISAVRDEDGSLLGYSKVTRDLTDRRRAEEERAARLAAEQATRAKDEFLAMLGHELRNPLSPIVTALDVIRLRGDDQSTKEHAIIERQVKHLMRLVDDLLDISRITRGKVDLRKQMVDLREVIARAIETTTPSLEQRRHHLHLDLPARATVVHGDESRLLQVFSNLITNASKYTDPGGNIHVAVRPGTSGHVVEVRDDGNGIEEALLPRIFELFVQGDQSAERATGGLGLGLSLARRLAELHGGSLEAASPGAGRGSTFTVVLPAAEVASPTAAGSTSVARKVEQVTTPLRVLLVDDNVDARTLLGDVLAAVGHEVRTVGDAVAALEQIPIFLPDVAVLDIGLPVMDGYELAEHLRDTLGSAAPYLIALTGYGRPHDIERSRNAGFAQHLVKPVEIPRLLASIATAPRRDQAEKNRSADSSG